MNKSLIKFLTDFGPLLIFFVVYYTTDNNLLFAIPPLILATFLSLIIVYVLEKKIPLIPLTGGILITFFGGLTLYFDNPVFLYIKPTIINLIFAGILIFGKYITKKPLLKIFFKNSIQMKEEGWSKLNDRWVIFFIFLAILNEIVWRTQTEFFWVNFKVWGLLSVTFLFTISQIPLLNKYGLNK
tara:strand:+ start:25 stop:576 length:552 start_codon:yes stop_codon:yes gene_type:complete